MTTYVDIPIIDYPIYDLTIPLEGNSYILEFTYVERMKLYTISLFDSDRNPIILGEALVPSYPIFLDYAIPNMTGAFYLLPKQSIVGEPYKEFPDQIAQYYYLVYAY